MLWSGRRAVWVLGVSQCVYWGVLYYGFSVLLMPIQTELGLSRSAVAGAFSASLLVGALTAPVVGRWIDRDHGPLMMRTGVLVAAAGLLLSAWITTLFGLYVAWIVIGIAMAAILYEPAFGVVIRAIENSQDRFRSLAAVTILGGLASTVFLPIIGMAVPAFGWRSTQILGAVVVLIAAWTLERYTFPNLRPHIEVNDVAHAPTAAQVFLAPPPRFTALAAIFVAGTLASMGLTTLLIPLLIERGHSVSAAAVVLAMLGVMQLPGRIWMLHGGHGTSRHALVTLPLALMAIGLAIVTIAQNMTFSASGVAIFGVGAGLQTLARPWLVQLLYGTTHAGHWNGRIARLQGFARAIGPFGAAVLSVSGGTSYVFAGLSLMLFAVILLGLLVLRAHKSAIARLPLEEAS